jgi:hypothetical protein
VEAFRVERKLVAILAADIEGYSRHMERDEATTLATLSGHVPTMAVSPERPATACWQISPASWKLSTAQ